MPVDSKKYGSLKVRSSETMYPIVINVDPRLANITNFMGNHSVCEN